jgi:hypothetical protein
MSVQQEMATKWTCDRCGVSVGRMDGTRAELPETWASSTAGCFCLACRRERAGEEALESAPSEAREARVKLRRAAIIEFEVRRTPEHADNAIAKACGSSAAVVAEARRRLGVAPPLPSAAKRRAMERGTRSR